MRGYCVTHIGGRPNHEDNVLFGGMYIYSDEQKEMSEKRSVCYTDNSSSRVQFFAVSDGMGGHNAGEVASHICVSKLAALEPTIQNCTSIRDVVTLCQRTISDINAEVCRLSRTNASQRGMGATLVLLAFCGSECAVLNIGDSRAYFFDGVSLKQISKDNTEGQRMLDLNLLTNEELKTFSARKNLNRYIGFDESNFTLTADEYVMSTQKGIYLLCSDGITDALTGEKIAAIFRDEQDIESITKHLVARAVSIDNADNATVMLISTKE